MGSIGEHSVVPRHNSPTLLKVFLPRLVSKAGGIESGNVVMYTEGGGSLGMMLCVQRESGNDVMCTEGGGSLGMMLCVQREEGVWE